MTQIYILLVSVVSLMLSVQAAEIPNALLPEIASETEADGWADLVLGAHSIIKERGTHRITVRGIYRGERVGFEVIVGSVWKGERLGGKIPAFVGRITFRSLGSESDAFVRALARLYKLDASGLAMKNELVFDVISLEGDPRALETQKVSTKLFYEPDNEKRYAEAYANFDLPSRKFYFKEKDPEYRENLLRAFRK